MPTKQNNKKRNRVRIIILVSVGVVAFVVSVYMNVVGMKNAINKAPDSSGMASFSVRNGNTSLSTSKTGGSLDDNEKIVEKDLLVNAVPVIQLINNNWDRLKINFKGYRLDNQGNAIFDEGYTLYCNGTYVEYAVFTKAYQNEIIGHLKIDTDFETIEKELGEPSFKKDGCIGYKTREIYIFFYENEIAIYPNRNISNKNLEDLINKYKDGTYEKGRTYFLADIRNNYNDFTISKDDETNVVTVTSITRQIVMNLDGNGDIKVELYNGYNVSNDATKQYIEQKVYSQKKEDLVEIIENERVSGK